MIPRMVVHSVLPPALIGAVAGVLVPAGVAHVAHGDSDPVRAASIAAADGDALALIRETRRGHAPDRAL